MGERLTMIKIILYLFVFLFIYGCTPKMDKVYAIQTQTSKRTAEISIIRNYNFSGSAIRIYPTVNDRKVAGLYTKDYIRFYVEEGKYIFGLTYPNVILGKWVKEKGIKKFVKANHQYYFLISPTLVGMEIEEINKTDGEKRISSSTYIETGKLSDKPDLIAKTIKPLAGVVGLKEEK